MKLDDALNGVSRLAFDTAPIIYFVEANPAYDHLVSAIFNRVAAGEIEGWTSVVSLSEVLVRPIASNRTDLQQSYSRAASPEFKLSHNSDNCDGGGESSRYSGNLWPSPTRCYSDSSGS